MMSIDFEIAFCFDLQVEVSMPRDLRQHVVEKRYPCRNLVFAGAVKIQVDADVGFLRFSRLCRFSRIHQFFSNARSSAARNLPFSSGVPIETRRHRSSRGYALTSRTSTP